MYTSKTVKMNNYTMNKMYSKNYMNLNSISIRPAGNTDHASSKKYKKKIKKKSKKLKTTKKSIKTKM